jgi:hypothetical protein
MLKKTQGRKRNTVGAGVLRPLCMTADPKVCTFARPYPIPESWMQSQKSANLKLEDSEKKEPWRPYALGYHFYQAVMRRRHLHTSTHTWDAGRLGMKDGWLHRQINLSLESSLFKSRSWCPQHLMAPIPNTLRSFGEAVWPGKSPCILARLFTAVSE